jgi:r-opsin
VSDLIPKRLGWNLSPEELTHVPEHWLAFPEPRPIYHYALGILYIFLFLAGVIGNGLVIWIFGT